MPGLDLPDGEPWREGHRIPAGCYGRPVLDGPWALLPLITFDHDDERILVVASYDTRDGRRRWVHGLRRTAHAQHDCGGVADGVLVVTADDGATTGLDVVTGAVVWSAAGAGDPAAHDGTLAAHVLLRRGGRTELVEARSGRTVVDLGPGRYWPTARVLGGNVVALVDGHVRAVTPSGTELWRVGDEVTGVFFDGATVAAQEGRRVTWHDVTGHVVRAVLLPDGAKVAGTPAGHILVAQEEPSGRWIGRLVAPGSGRAVATYVLGEDAIPTTLTGTLVVVRDAAGQQRVQDWTTGRTGGPLPGWPYLDGRGRALFAVGGPDSTTFWAVDERALVDAPDASPAAEV